LFTNSENGLSFLRELLDDSVGGSHQGPLYLDYERYGSPSWLLTHLILKEGAPAALATYRKRKLKAEKGISETLMNQLGYRLLSLKKVSDAIAVFLQNTEDCPKSGNTWDSLAEAYMNNGDKGRAIQDYQKSLELDPTVQLLAADMDPWAAGLYLVPSDRRVIVPPGTSPGFADALLALCVDHGVDLLIPTVDCELGAVAGQADRFTAAGIRLLLPPAAVLEVTLDKLALATACADVVRVPRTECAATTDPAGWSYPVIVKPRRGSGSRGVAVVDSADGLRARRLGDDMLVQEYLPGEEYSVDVLADPSGAVVAAVPRVRQRVDSGVSVAGYTVVDPELEGFAVAVVEALGLPFVSNVQIRRDDAGRPALLEINPRVPGSLALTVAAGVDMARLAVDALRGRPLPATVPHRAVAMVRYLADHVVELDQLVPDPEATPVVGTAVGS